ncbi:ferrous iron transport protein B [Richelia sinica FACHB-800]|uniref:Ferrous iron transport protein B n=1 Tax=Richelia sinica FACHB-800 TaxID=1357546 RepID=A0A975T395_9NOST|nr:ferrous iron transport protein B [Richelia sinica]MBD2667025.1 ferrous iron transport protein B [Richelia sinica FACHB-800]QXE21363.1 ferrous iron transport protein B [Richelia sinica FACHB-800]
MKNIAVLGMPNTGKSTFFNRLTGATASIGNWPGITVDLMMAQVKFGGETVEVIDLPGIYDLRGFSDDEKVVRDFLEHTPLNLLLLILNTTQIDRQISLALQVKHLGLPAVLLLNMSDEAPEFGVEVEPEKMSAHLGMPVMPISAKYGSGYGEAYQAIEDSIQHQNLPVVVGDITEHLVADHQIATEMGHLLQDAVHTPSHIHENLTTRFDRILLHPVWGLPIFFTAMYLMFQFIYAVGTPLQEWMGGIFDWLQTSVLVPALANAPELLRGFLIDGLYTGVSTVAAFIPVIVLFFLMMAIIEDSGYLSRSAFLMDALMAKLGLDGRSFVMSLMGFGCNVPAIMGTRVMRSPALRMLSMLVIPFSLCSARLNVFLFITTALFSPRHAPLVLFSLYLLSFVATIVTALLFKHHYPNQEPFVLELPPYRFPTGKQMVIRAWCEVKNFVKWSHRFIIFGVVAIWALNNLPPGVPAASSQTLSGIIGQFTQPFLAPLGINPQLAVALIFGFIAKEIVLGGLAVIYGQNDDGQLAGVIANQIDWVQAYSFMLFTLLYVPCLSAIAVLKTESKSVKFTILAVAWSIALAWISSFIFYQGARALGL